METRTGIDGLYWLVVLLTVDRILQGFGVY